MISPDPDTLDQKERRQYRSTVRFVSIVLQALAFVGLLAWGLFTKAPPVKAGTPAPQFELELFSGGGGADLGYPARSDAFLT